MQSESTITSSQGATSADPSGLFGRVVNSPAAFITLLAVLFATHVGVRVFSSPVPELDESWQIVLSQTWSLGYHAHPPLYTWLQILFFKTFGESIFSLALLKNALLFGLYAFTYASARLLTRDNAKAAFATLCLLLIPQIAWECQRDLTHSVLLSTATAATLFTFLRIVDRPSAVRYSLLGVCIGTLLLAKYNAAIFILGAAIAMMFVPRYRALLLTPRLAWTVIFCLLVSGPHFWWVAANASDAFASMRKLEFRAKATYGDVALKLPYRMMKAVLPNLIPVFVVFFLGRWRKSFALRSDTGRMLFWGSVLAVAMLCLGMFASKALGLRGRWFLPIFVAAPVFLVAELPAIPRWLYRLVGTVASVGVIAVLILLPLHGRQGGGERGQDLMVGTVTDVAASSGELIRNADVIMAESFWIGGATRLQFRRPVITPSSTNALPANSSRIAVVYDASKSDTPSEDMQEFVDSTLHRTNTLRVVHTTPAGNRRKTGMRLGVAVVD